VNVTSKAQLIKKLPQVLYKAAAQSWIDHKYPRHLFIETTAICNLTCSFCPRERKAADMDFSLFKQIIDEASSYGTRSFSLHLFGEPLLYPQWLEAVTYIKEKNKRHTVLLTTNGTKINETVDRIVASGINQILWSWRPEATFTKETKEKLRQWGKFRVRFIEEVTPVAAYKEWKDWSNTETRRLHNYGGNIDLEGLELDSPLEKQSGNAKTATRWPCYHLWLAPAVAWNGKILICCADPKQLEVIGQFPQSSVAEAWNGKMLQSIRDSHLRGEYKGICESCDIYKSYPDMFFKWQKR